MAYMSNSTYNIDRTILESMYTTYNLWKTSFSVVGLSAYVSITTLPTALGNYARSTDLASYVTTDSFTTTLGSYARSTDLTSHVTTDSFTTALGSNAKSTDLTSHVSSAALTAALSTPIMLPGKPHFPLWI